MVRLHLVEAADERSDPKGRCEPAADRLASRAVRHLVDAFLAGIT
ncbi:hypothetical protein AB0C76_14700 [Kitasatospora sp. NPDC048722]